MIKTEETKSLDQHGYVVVPRFLNHEQIYDITERYEKQWLRLLCEGSIPIRSAIQLEKLYPRLKDYHRKDTHIEKFILDSGIFRLMEQIVGEEVLLIASSYYFKSPGTRGLPLHQDNYAFGVYPDTTYAAWLSLNRSDSENGGMTMVPGTHRTELLSPNSDPENVKEYFSDYGQKVEIDEQHVVDIPTDIGDALIFNGNIIHGSRDNTSRYRFRESLLLHFAPASTERLTLNFNKLLDKAGNRVRKRLNTESKITEKQRSVFSIRDANYFENWK